MPGGGQEVYLQYGENALKKKWCHLDESWDLDASRGRKVRGKVMSPKKVFEQGRFGTSIGKTSEWLSGGVDDPLIQKREEGH